MAQPFFDFVSQFATREPSWNQLVYSAHSHKPSSYKHGNILAIAQVSDVVTASFDYVTRCFKHSHSPYEKQYTPFTEACTPAVVTKW